MTRPNGLPNVGGLGPAIDLGQAMSPIKWSRVAYCAGVVVVETVLVTHETSAWITFPLGAVAAWWTFVCTREVWAWAAFHIAVWRLHQGPAPISVEDIVNNKRAAGRRWQSLSNPALDRWINLGTVLLALALPALLWSRLVVWLVIG